MFNSLYAIMLIVLMCHGYPPTSPVWVFVMVDTSTHEPALRVMHVVLGTERCSHIVSYHPAVYQHWYWSDEWSAYPGVATP